MSRTQQDQFIDDEEEETCPLCVEELSFDDKNFKPCPCGYQVRSSSWLSELHAATDTMLDMPLLLEQHQEHDERPMPCLPKTIQ